LADKKTKVRVSVLKHASSDMVDILKTREDPDEPLSEYEGTEPFEYYEPPYDPKALVDLMSISTTHARCVKAKAADAAGLGYEVRSVKVGEVPSPDVVNKINDWARHLNKDFDLNGILEELVKDRESIGWGCLEVIRDQAGRVSRLSPIASSSIRVLRDPKPGQAKYVQVSYSEPKVFFLEFPEKFQNGKHTFVSPKDGKTPETSVMTSANELIFWKKPHVSATKWYGLPDIIPASGDVAAVRLIRDHFLSFFDNHCIPRHAVIIKGAEVDEQTAATISGFFASKFKKDPHKTLVLSSDDPDFEVTFEPVEAEQIEADYRETRKDLRDFIRLSHGIPPAILGIEGGTSAGAGSGLSQAEIYLNRIITPIQRGLHNILDNLLEYGLGITDVVIRLSAPDIRDLNLEMRRDTQYISHGVLSINEVRQSLGMPSVEGGDRHFIWSRRTSPKVVGVDTGADGVDTGAGTESEGGGGGGAVSDMNRA